jgi:hypothetical protein
VVLVEASRKAKQKLSSFIQLSTLRGDFHQRSLYSRQRARKGFRSRPCGGVSEHAYCKVGAFYISCNHLRSLTSATTLSRVEIVEGELNVGQKRSLGQQEIKGEGRRVPRKRNCVDDGICHTPGKDDIRKSETKQRTKTKAMQQSVFPRRVRLVVIEEPFVEISQQCHEAYGVEHAKAQENKRKRTRVTVEAETGTCGHEWNTFDTGGVCPACVHQWTETQCPFLQPMVATFGLVCKLIRPSTKQSQKFVHVIAHCAAGGVDHNVFALPRFIFP